MPTTSHLWRDSPVPVFVNAAARGGRGLKRLSRVRRVFETLDIRAEFFLTESPADLETRAQDAIAAGARLLVAMGGDGTFQGLVNAAQGTDVLLSVLPAGGGNDFAAALGLPEDLAEAATSLFSRGQPRPVDLVRAQTADGNQRLYAGGAGLGLDADAAQYANAALRRVPGRLRYVASALRALRRFAPLRVRAEFPGTELPPVEAAVLVAAVLNTPSYGAGLYLAPEAKIDDGLFNLVFVNELSASNVLAVLPRLLRRGELPQSRVRQFALRQVRLTANRPCLFHADGEILGPVPVELTIVPHAVQVLAPAQPEAYARREQLPSTAQTHS